MKDLEIKGTGYKSLFMPDSISGISSDGLKDIAEGVRQQLQTLKETSGKVENDHGSFSFYDEAARAIICASTLVKNLCFESDLVRFPETKPERQALGSVLVEVLLKVKKRIRFIAPVCPDYERGVRFYRLIGDGISPEAEAAINAVRVIIPDFVKAGYKPTLEVVVANTEDDKKEIMENVVGGDISLYHARCEESVKSIEERTKGFGEVRVGTFTGIFGDQFRNYQHCYEEIIRRAMLYDEKLRVNIEGIGMERASRHSQILGREERQYELTIRYIAQYAALGTIAREQEGFVVFLNYQTPNRLFFNAVVNKSPLIRLSHLDDQVVPVLGTIARRQYEK